LKKILLVGQTPPPYGGQAMMIKRTLDGDFGPKIKLVHVRVQFSKDMDSISKFRIKKVFHLIKVISLIYWNVIINGTKILYYFPAGPRTIPVIRDFFLLGTTRFLFDKVIFHFRAAGLSEYIESRNPFFRKILLKVYSEPEASIRLSEYTPLDDMYIRSKKSFIVLNGIEDCYENFIMENNENKIVKHILYLGVLSKTKGVLEILYAFKELKNKRVILDLVGKFEDTNFEKQVIDFLTINNISDKVKLHGVKIGKEKLTLLNSCDIFLFPSYFESEGVPGAIIEAMSFAKPIIATKWRGIPSLVYEGINGFLIPPHDTKMLISRIEILFENQDICKEFGRQSRYIYLQKFTLKNYYENLKAVFEEI